MQPRFLIFIAIALLAQAATASWVWIPNHLERFVPSEMDASSAHDGGASPSLARMTRSDVGGSAFGEGIPPRAVRYQRTGGAILLGRR